MKNKRVFLLIPEGLTFDMLDEKQQEAIAVVLGEYKTGTITYEGKQVVDAIVVEGFNPDEMKDYGIAWPILGLWVWVGDEMKELVMLDRANWLNYLPPTYEYDETGNIIAEHEPVFHIPHNWGGWPEIEEEI